MRFQSFLLFAFLLAFVISEDEDVLSSGPPGDYSDCSRQLISVAMISNRVRPAEFSINQRIFDHVKNFTRTLFAEQHKAIKEGRDKSIYLTEMKIWPPVMAADCDGNTDRPSKGRGSNIAHRDIWEHFYRNRRIHCEKKNLSAYGRSVEDVLIIFEYDAFIGVENAASITIETVKQLKKDLLYLGYCYQKRKGSHPKYSNIAPFCLHAYAITITGSKKLIDLVDPCGGYADAQLYNLANHQNITWDFINQEYDNYLIQHLFNEQGIHLSGSFEYSGIFVQVKYDEILTSNHYQEGMFAHNRLHQKVIFCLWKNIWRPIGNYDDYLELNPSSQAESVMQLSPYQFRKFPKSENVLTKEEIQAIKAYKIKKREEPQQKQQQQKPSRER